MGLEGESVLARVCACVCACVFPQAPQPQSFMDHGNFQGLQLKDKQLKIEGWCTTPARAARGGGMWEEVSMWGWRKRVLSH